MTTAPQQAEPEESHDEIEHCLQAAAAAAPLWAQWTPKQRADALSAVADALDAEGPTLIVEAMRESGLGEARLTGELRRTSVQLRMFADELRDGSYLRIALDRQDRKSVV